MKNEKKFEIGLALNSIAMLLDDENLAKVREYLNKIEDIVSSENACVSASLSCEPCKEEKDCVLHKTFRQGYEAALDNSIRVVKDYFCKLIDENPEWESNSIDDFALIPNKAICTKLEEMRGQKNE